MHLEREGIFMEDAATYVLPSIRNKKTTFEHSDIVCLIFKIMHILHEKVFHQTSSQV